MMGTVKSTGAINTSLRSDLCLNSGNLCKNLTNYGDRWGKIPTVSASSLVPGLPMTSLPPNITSGGYN